MTAGKTGEAMDILLSDETRIPLEEALGDERYRP